MIKIYEKNFLKSFNMNFKLFYFYKGIFYILFWVFMVVFLEVLFIETL